MEECGENKAGEIVLVRNDKDFNQITSHSIIEPLLAEKAEQVTVVDVQEHIKEVFRIKKKKSQS